MDRTTWVLGNWKQNHRPEAAADTARRIADGLASAMSGADPSAGQVHVGIAPPYLSIASARPFARPAHPVWLFAQDVAAQDAGAFTGEVGPAMLSAAGVDGAIIGHSERRALYAEDDALIAAKVRCALEGGLTVVLCVGESLEIRERGEHESTVISQLCAALGDVDLEAVGPRLVVAYEPVWAIGTGRTATPSQASEMHRALRRFLRERSGDAGGDRSILYGGSVKPDNAAELMAAGDLDGFLVGGASLDPEAFLAIVAAAARTPRPRS
jgi:triosephosphate isomerase (TIM)